MDAMTFRWIDQTLAKFTIKTKLLTLFWLPIIAILGITLFSMNQARQIRIDDAIASLTVQVTTTAALASSQAQLPQGLSRSSHAQPGMQVRDELITIAAITPQGDYVTGQLNLVHYALFDRQKATLIFIGLAIVLLGGVSYFLLSFVQNATTSINRALRLAADGDLTHRLNFMNAPDEFSQLASNLDRLTQRQHDMVKLISQSADALEMFADECRTAAQEGESVAQHQRQYLDSLATAMEQMTAAIREVARNANDTSMQTRQSSEEAKHGAASINRTIDAIQALADEISHASSAVEHLTVRANKINEVVTVISSISGQTNLLALNAAIEAARAGEQGRGFAVVADEVRTLAGRTQQATVEIQKMIEELETGTGSLNDIMEKTVLKAAQSRELISEVGQEIERIASYGQAMFEMSAQIATSAEVQSSVAADIAHNLDEVRQQSLQVEESAASTVAGTSNLKITAQELTNLLHGLKV